MNMMNGRLVVLCLAASGLGAGVATFCVMTAMKQEALPQATQSAVSEALLLRLEDSLAEVQGELSVVRRQLEVASAQEKSLVDISQSSIRQNKIADIVQGQDRADSFINSVRLSVQQAWVIPPGTESGAVVEVAVRLGAAGELYSASITQSSGNADVDRSVLLAVEAAAPFPKIRQLPAGLQQDYRQFNLRFTPGDRV